ncbi:hypothetical protein ACJMK2_011474 [Sinanodonta woodiana]|uniref:Sm domain-containing protein n=1 Tax=Sinanodonta woodiana TaxID=1069815 RepID=A0ABD3V568_SINWO
MNVNIHTVPVATMMNNTKRRGRPNQGRFERPEHKRADYYGDRPNRPRVQQPQPTEKQLTSDGIYANPRFTHVLISLVGLNVQVQVKNGILYEGILRTYSSKMDVVLEMAHKVETSNNLTNIPSHDRIMEKLIIKLSDVVVVNAANVDMDYAVKDSFTDSAISKYNGEEKDFKELQPWESEGPDDMLPLGSEPSNGWDVNEMFRTNKEQFNVQSSYDESLTQYTTPLEKKDTDDYRKREEHASRIAKEIESSDIYNRRISLENGEGDEEMIYSAVVRENNNSPSSQSGTVGGGKYVPPARRNQTGPNRHQRGYYTKNSPTNQSFAHQQQHQHHNLPQRQQQKQQQQCQQQQSQHRPSLQMSMPPVHMEARVNGVEERKQELVTADKTSPIQEQFTKPNSPKTSAVTSASGSDPYKVESTNTSPVQSKSEVRKTPTKGRDAQIKELKEFSHQFKLGDDKEKADKEMGRKVEEEEHLDGTVGEEIKIDSTSPVLDLKEKENEKTVAENDSKKYDDILKSSNLNPMAKDFIYQPKTYQSKQPAQIPTPPRPQTQSPIIQPIPMVQAQPVYPSPGQPFMVPPNIMPAIPQQAPSQQGFRPPPKRAVVSVQPRADLSAAAAQAATGQPLLAQTPHNHFVYFSSQGLPGPQPTGYQMGQVMSMPATNPSGHVPRYASMVPTSHQQGNMDPSSQPPVGTGHVFMPSQHGAIPAHLNHPGHLNHASGHMTHHPGVGPHQGQHGGQMNPQTGGHHPAPSPVHSAGPTPQQPPQVHPPSSGTPQPVGGYPQGGMHPHPPLQPSPHNPPSTQNVQHMQYHLTPGGQLLPGPPHLSVTQTYSLPHGPSPHMAHHQLIMMPQPPHGQLQHHHLQQATQFQGHHMSGPGQVHNQPQMIPSASVHHSMHSQNHAQGHPPAHQLHFVPPAVHGTQGAPQVQAYHHPQTQ